MAFVTETFSKLHEIYPDIRFHTFSGDAQTVMERLNKGLIDTSGERNLTFRPFDPDITVDAYIVTKKYQTFSPAVKAFLEQLREQVR